MLEFLNHPIINKSFKIILCIIVSYVIYEIIKTLMNKRNTQNMRKRKKTIRKLILNIIKYLIITFALLAILSILGVNVTSILAGLGIVGVVLGLALQDIMKDIFSGISIILEEQFDIGDYVIINNFEGNVIDLGLKSTKIKNIRGEIKIISNRTITEVTNLSKTTPAVLIDIPIPYEIKNTLADKTINNIIIRASKEIENLQDNIELLGLDEFKDSYISYRLKMLVGIDKQWMAKRQINRIIKEEFDKSKISVPYNIIEVKNG